MFVNRRAHTFLAAATIVAATLIAYAPALRAGFIWDDDTLLTDNPLVLAPDGIYRLWFMASTPDYFPLTSSAFWTEWRLWGKDPFGYHLVNVLLCAAGAVLLWRVLRRLEIPGAWLAGMLFALHPVAVASVAWVSELKSMLAMPLFLASILAWLKAEERWNGARSGARIADAGRTAAIGIRHYLLSLGLFFLALLAKTAVVMLPMVLLLCIWWRKGRIARRDAARVAPFAALAGAMGLLTIWYQYHNAIGNTVIRTDGPAARAACAGWAAWFYLYKALLPAGLSPIYPRWTTCASLLAFIPALALIAMLLVFAHFRRSWGRPCLFAFAYFLAMLLPILGFVKIYFMRYSLVADQWEYPALIGVVALAAGCLGRLMERPGGRRIAAAAFAGALILACGALTFRQTFAYRDEETYWRFTLEKNPDAWVARGSLAYLLACKAMALGPGAELSAAAERYLAEAASQLDRAIALNPDFAEAYCYRGNIESAAGQSAAAMRDYDRAIAIKPDYSEAYVNRGNMRAASEEYSAAIMDYSQAILLNPELPEAWFNLGKAHLATGRPQDAAEDLSRAISLRPDYVQAYLKRAAAYYEAKDFSRALLDARAAQRLGARINPAFLSALEEGAGRPNPGR